MCVFPWLVRPAPRPVLCSVPVWGAVAQETMDCISRQGRVWTQRLTGAWALFWGQSHGTAVDRVTGTRLGSGPRRVPLRAQGRAWRTVPLPPVVPPARRALGWCAALNDGGSGLSCQGKDVGWDPSPCCGTLPTWQPQPVPWEKP